MRIAILSLASSELERRPLLRRVILFRLSLLRVVALFFYIINMQLHLSWHDSIQTCFPKEELLLQGKCVSPTPMFITRKMQLLWPLHGIWQDKFHGLRLKSTLGITKNLRQIFPHHIPLCQLWQMTFDLVMTNFSHWLQQCLVMTFFEYKYFILCVFKNKWSHYLIFFKSLCLHNHLILLCLLSD